MRSFALLFIVLVSATHFDRQSHVEAAGEDCSALKQGKNIFGNDVANEKGEPQDCCEHCKRNSKCEAFIWTDKDGGTCWLKSATGLILPTSGFLMGTKSPTPPPPVKNECTALMPHKNIFGNDLTNKKGQPHECCGICKRTSECAAFVWTDKDGGTCWLKKTTIPVVPDLGYIITGFV